MAFRKESELKKHLEGILKQALNEVAKEAKEQLYNFILREWYLARPESEFYERTYDLINSLNISPLEGSRVFKIHTYFDLSKIQANYTGAGFNQHMSLDGSFSFDSKSISYWILEWLENGNNGSIGNNPINGIHFMENVNKFLENGEIDKIVRKTFKKYGIDLIRQ